MPITEKEIEDADWRFSFMKPGTAQVWVGPGTVSFWNEPVIHLDGRHYLCAGRLFFRDGTVVRAHFQIQTHTFDYLERDSVWCCVNDVWYRLTEPELYQALRIDPATALPYRWQPDIPLAGEVGQTYRADSYDQTM